ncbi:MAG: hypothetical protein ABGZ53_25785 [Fuerstiella sp.]|jgi:hypothetical protein
MEFEDLQKVWDAQNERHIYAIDEKILHKRVIKSQSEIMLMVNIVEWSMFISMLTLSLMVLQDGIFNDELYQVPEAIILLVATGYIYRARRDRLRNEPQSDFSLLGNLNQALQAIGHHAKQQRNFIWWYVTPMISTTVIHMVYTFDGKPIWLWPLAIGMFIVFNWIVQRTLNNRILPSKDDLESLRNMLTGPES